MITQDEELGMMINGMAYRQPIINRLDQQTKKGINKYGNTIDKSGYLKSGIDRLNYLAEELTDGLVYIEHAKEYIQQLEEDRKFLFMLMTKENLQKVSEEDWVTYREIGNRILVSTL